MTSQIIICMAIFVVTLISYMLNKIPMWVTAMLSMAALYITGCIDDTGALSGFANNNTILMATMFMVAAGFRRTSLVETMCNGLLRLTKGSFQKAYVGHLLLGALLTNFISSPMVVYAIVSPLMAALCDKVGQSRSKYMFPLMIVCLLLRHPAPAQCHPAGRTVHRFYGNLRLHRHDLPAHLLLPGCLARAADCGGLVRHSGTQVLPCRAGDSHYHQGPGRHPDPEAAVPLR